MLKLTFKSFVLGSMFLSTTLPTLATYEAETDQSDAQKRSLQVEKTDSILSTAEIALQNSTLTQNKAEELLREKENNFKDIIKCAGNPHNLLEFLEKSPNAFSNFYQNEPIDNALLLSFIKKLFPSPQLRANSFALSSEERNNLGLFSQLPDEIIARIRDELWEIYGDVDLARANRGMFTIITGLSKEKISTKKNPKRLFEVPLSVLDNPFSNFKDEKTSLTREGLLTAGKDFFSHMPAYVWKGFVREMKGLPKALFPFLRSTIITDISEIDLASGHVSLLNFALNLHGTHVHNIFLVGKSFKDDDIRNLALYLEGTNVRTMDLAGNLISDAGAIGFAENLPGTVHTVDLSNNCIEEETKQLLRETYPHITWTL